MNQRIIYQAMQREADTLAGKLCFWRILAGGLFVTVVVLLCLWPN